MKYKVRRKQNVSEIFLFEFECKGPPCILSILFNNSIQLEIQGKVKPLKKNLFTTPAIFTDESAPKRGRDPRKLALF